MDTERIAMTRQELLKWLPAACVKLHGEVFDALEAAQRRVTELEATERMRQDAASHGIGYWAWQGDGEDHLESLSCPVLIRPHQLLEITAEVERLRAQAEGVTQYLENEPECCPSVQLWGLIKHLQGILREAAEAAGGDDGN